MRLWVIVCDCEWLYAIKNFRLSSPKLSKTLSVMKHYKVMFVKKELLRKTFLFRSYLNDLQIQKANAKIMSQEFLFQMCSPKFWIGCQTQIFQNLGQELLAAIFTPLQWNLLCCMCFSANMKIQNLQTKNILCFDTVPGDEKSR